MKAFSFSLTIKRLLAVAAIGVTLTGLAGVSLAADNQDQSRQQAWAQRAGEMHEKHMQMLAKRLNIQASQQAEWKSFSDALAGLHPAAGMTHPDKNADAATLAKFGADMAAEHAKKLAVVADATAKLQAVLNPEQAKTFNMMAHHFMMMHMRGGHHDGHAMMDHRPDGMHGKPADAPAASAASK